MNNVPAPDIIYQTKQDYSNLVKELNSRIRIGSKDCTPLTKENRQL